MSTFRLSDMDVHWSGVDHATPPGHCLAVGLDPLGNTRIWLFKGDKPSDEGFCGSLLVPSSERLQAGGRTNAYGRTGAWVTSQGDYTQMLERLAERAAR